MRFFVLPAKVIELARLRGSFQPFPKTMFGTALQLIDFSALVLSARAFQNHSFLECGVGRAASLFPILGVDAL
jgi:hypothetical protein